MKKTMMLSAFLFMVCLVSSAAATTWPGPDLQGYTGATIPYSFADISGSGTSLALGDDELSAAVPIGFSFNFYGTIYTNVFVASNGFLTFDAAANPGCCEGQNLPDPMGPNNLIAGYWTDLNPSAGGTIHYLTTGGAGSRRFIVQFLNVPLAGGGTTASFQMILHEGTGNIEMQFLNCSSNGGQVYVTGIEDSAGAAALRYNYGDYSLSGLGILITPPAITIGSQPVDGVVCAGAGGSFTAAATSPSGPALQWQVSTDGGLTYTDIPGATLPTLNIAGALAINGNRFRAIFSNWANTVATNSALLTVSSVTVTSPVMSSGFALAPYPGTQFGMAGGVGAPTFSITGGSLPGGMSLSSSGLLSGTPLEPWTYHFTVTASDSNSCSGSNMYSLMINPAATVAVPTLNEWGMILFMMMSGLGALLYLRRAAGRRDESD